MLMNKAAMCRRKCLRPLQLIQIMLASRRCALNYENRIYFLLQYVYICQNSETKHGGLSSLCFI